MSYRSPQWYLDHVGRRIGSSSITVTNENSAFPKENLSDDRGGSLFINSVAAANQSIIWDRGSFATSIDGCFVINNGSMVLSGVLQSDTDPAFGTPTALATIGVSIFAILEMTFTGTTERYLRMISVPSKKFTLPQVIWSTKRTTTRGPDPEWEGPTPIPHVLHSEKADGSFAHFQRGREGKRWKLIYRRVKDTADISALDALFAHGTHLPFIFIPPDTTYGALWAVLTSRQKFNDHPNPSGVTGQRLRYEFELEEHLA